MNDRSFAEDFSRLTTEHSHLAVALDRMTEEQRRRLSDAARIVTVTRGAQVVEEGKESVEIGYVLDGALGMIKTLPDGRDHIIGVLVPTDMYGRLFDGPNDHAIRALEDSRILCFDRPAFEAVLRENSDLERRFLVSVLDELDAAREWILLLNGTSVVERVAAFLVILARRHNRNGANGGAAVTVRIPMRRADFARCLGVRPESLSRAIHRLAEDGTIRLIGPDEFLIPDIGELIDASGQDLVMPEPASALRRTR